MGQGCRWSDNYPSRRFFYRIKQSFLLYEPPVPRRKRRRRKCIIRKDKDRLSKTLAKKGLTVDIEEYKRYCSERFRDCISVYLADPNKEK
jgi:hypothetical protein